MYELTGTIKDLSVDYFSDKAFLTLAIDQKQTAMNCVDELGREGKLSVKISKHKKRRSLDANAYCWKLIGKLAEKLNMPKTEIYRAAIKEIGGNYEVVCVKNEAVERLCYGWEKNGLGWQTDTMPSKLEGCTNVLLYYGSSTYDTLQMSRLIDNVVTACEEQGIETRSQAELDSLMRSWSGR